MKKFFVCATAQGRMVPGLQALVADQVRRTHVHNRALSNLLRKVEWKAEVLLQVASHHEAQMYQWPLLWLEKLLDTFFLFFFSPLCLYLCIPCR